MRSPAVMDILVIDLTNRCFLKCSNCTRDIAHQTQTKEMTPDVFRQALRSLIGWWRPGRVIGLIGGEPTLNRNFEEICQIFRQDFNPGTDTKHGRAPILDFDSFARERLFDRTNGKGLWTSFGPKFQDYYETIMDTFSHWNANDHSTGQGVHQTSLVDAREMCEALGIPWQDWPRYRDNCWLQNAWSAAITPDGKAYFCERAAQLDLLYNGGRLGWEIVAEPDWWRRTPDQFGPQLSICEMCSMALPGPGQRDALERDILGKTHVERLIQIGSPAVKQGHYEPFDPKTHLERRHIDRRDNYVAPSGIRVASGNRHVYAKHLACVVVCVGRARHLAMTLPRNVGQVDEMVVVTTSGDTSTQATVRAIEGVRLVISDRCYDDCHAFNKGRMLNDGLRALTKADWVVLTDADVFLSARLKQWASTHAINPGVLYGTKRIDSDASQVQQMLGVLLLEEGRLAEVTATGFDAEPNGYFQLFNRRASSTGDRWPAVMSESFCSAGGIDSWFLQQFPLDKRHVVPELAVVHIEHAECLGAGWNDAARPEGPSWRQFGLLTPQGLYATEFPPPGPLRVRLTDTLHGVTFELSVGDDRSLPMDVARVDGKGGLVFCGQPIGHCCVHVAWWGERRP